MSTTVTFSNFVTPSVSHRIDITNRHIIRDTKSRAIIKDGTEESQIKAYSEHRSWMMYRYKFETFVKLICDEGEIAGWYSNKKSIEQMKANDSVYLKAGLPLRPGRERD